MFPPTGAVKSVTQIPTRRFERPEVDVDQHEVDDGWTVLFTFPRLEDVTFFQAFAVEDFRVNLRERELVHACPFLSQKKLLQICGNKRSWKKEVALRVVHLQQCVTVQ